VTGRLLAAGAIESATRRPWRDWGGSWARFTICHGRPEHVYCGTARRSSPFLYADCFDVSVKAAKALRRRRP
jgi:hypothetical protein